MAGCDRMELERIGKYEIVGELGRGTMGEVYKAKDPVLNRFVALKTLTARVAPGDETLQRFQREAQAAALLNHPNIVTVHDFGEEDGLLYMAMELLEGADLRDAIDNELLKTLDEKLDVMDGILAALDYAHAKGVVHRDIKPANIHLGPGRQVKIMDFGLARVSTSEMTQEGIVLGTPNYMSPEQALGDKVDGRSDLFSTGAVLYELLTGHKPFESDSTPSVLFQVVHRQAPPVRRWVPDVPTGVVAVVNRSLEKDREKRFASAGDMRAAIAVARQALAPAVSPKAPPLPPVRPTRPVPPPLPSNAAPSVPPDPFAAAAPPVPPRPRVPAPQPMPPPPAQWTSSQTLPPGSARRVRRSLLRPLVAGAGLAVLALGGVATLGLLLRSRPAPAPTPSSSSAVSELTQELVRKQVRLAQRELDDKNYAAAATEAEGALKLAPGHAEASAVLASTRERVAELDQSIAQARRLLDAGDTAGASAELLHLLELDPRHPAAAELSARLNSAFRAQADAAAASMREARAAALAAGATAWSLRSVDAGVSQAELLLSKSEFADATRMFLEARDACDRSRRAALLREAATPAPGGTPAVAQAAAKPAPTAPSVASPPATLPPAPAAAPPVAARGFSADATSVATPSAGGLDGFDSSEVNSRRPPQFAGRLEFEVLPKAVRPGEPFVVRIHLRNDGRRPVKIRDVSLVAVVDGRRAPASVTALQREVSPQWRALVAEYSGVWSEAASWALEAVVTADRDERITSRLRAN
ncbi:MAG TPA: serine/threonine-protein kinase [Vicinamibacteria bacterium]|nr:serine/threonine-protein kinase [Vicinamibacteria bacterium]